MVIALWVIALLMFASVVYLQKFMRDMAKVESDLIKELRDMKVILTRINEKQL